MEWWDEGAALIGFIGLGALVAFGTWDDEDDDLSARRFSRVPRSIFDESFSDNKPERRNNDSIRPSRFSRPSIYFALGYHVSASSCICIEKDLNPYPLGGFLFFST